MDATNILQSCERGGAAPAGADLDSALGAHRLAAPHLQPLTLGAIILCEVPDGGAARRQIDALAELPVSDWPAKDGLTSAEMRDAQLLYLRGYITALAVEESR